tara:strand:+ start:1350 stop:1748 length:399 start_codon:yes stop_codon:yes gene_type:complete
MARRQSQAYYDTMALEPALVDLVIAAVLSRSGLPGPQRAMAHQGIERLYRAGFQDDLHRALLAAVDERVGVPLLGRQPMPSMPPAKKRVSKYHKKYGREFKKLAPAYKKKNGSWKKNGFKRCAAAARRKCKK